MTPTRRNPDETVTRTPSMLWWRDDDGMADIELGWNVLTRFHETDAAGLLSGLAGDSASGEFHVWEYLRLPKGRSEALVATNWENLPQSTAGLSMVGLIVPPDWTPEDALNVLRFTNPILPETALLLRCLTDGMIHAWLWRKAADAVEPLRLEFDRDPAALALKRYEPFQPLHITSSPDSFHGESAPVPVVAPAALPAPQPSAPPAPQPAAAAPTVVRIEFPKWLWAAGMILATAVLAFTAWLIARDRLDQTAPAAAVPSQPRMNLEIRRGDGGLDIRWDGSAVALLGAQSGVLRITDNGQPTDVPLSSIDLNTGKLLYVPRSGSVEILLTVSTARGPLREAVRVIGGAPEPAQRIAVRPPAAAAAKPAAPSAPPAAAAPEPTEPVVTRQRFEPQVAAPKPAAEPALSAPPPTVVAQNTAPEPALRVDRLPEPPPSLPSPQAAAPATQQAAAPVQQLQTPEPARNPVIIPPKPLRQASPVVPAHLRQIMPQTTIITVRLKIDAQGRVTDAQTEEAAGLMSHLSKMARDAGRQWRFEPATLNGRPIQADHVIHFKFSK